MLINGACTLVENAEYVLAGHTEKAEQFAAARRKEFPNAPPWQLLATVLPRHQKEAEAMYPSVTQWFGPEMGVCATSASKGVKIGFALGFDEAILCGCPMDGSGYAFGEAEVPQSPNCLRVGDPGVVKHLFGFDGKNIKVQDTRIVRKYRESFKTLAETEFKGRVFSMSGFTRACCGEPR